MIPRYEDDLQDDEPSYLPRQPPRRHSLMGIASFVLAVATGIWGVFLCLVVGIAEEQTPGGLDDNSPLMIAGILGFLASLVVSLLGLVVGFVALLERDRIKVFAILGIVLNGLILAGIVLLMLIGMLVMA